MPTASTPAKTVEQINPHSNSNVIPKLNNKMLINNSNKNKNISIDKYIDELNEDININNINKNDSIQKKYDKFKQKLDIYDDESELLKDYLRAFYLSAKLLTLVIEIPNPKTNRDYLFSIFQLVLSLLLFSAIIGTVGYIISNLNNAAKEFQCKLLI